MDMDTEIEVKKSFGQVVRAVRKQQGWSQRELVNRVAARVKGRWRPRASWVSLVEHGRLLNGEHVPFLPSPPHLEALFGVLRDIGPALPGLEDCVAEASLSIQDVICQAGEARAALALRRHRAKYAVFLHPQSFGA